MREGTVAGLPTEGKVWQCNVLEEKVRGVAKAGGAVRWGSGEWEVKTVLVK